MKLEISQKTLESLYVIKKYTIYEIGAKVDCSGQTVASRLKEFGISRRKPARRPPEIKPFYGFLTVLKVLPKKRGKDRSCLCECKCGNQKVIAVNNLRNGSTISCGCNRWKKGAENPSWKGCGLIKMPRWSNIRRGAVNRNIPFNITIEEAWNIFQNQKGKCALTGLPLTFQDRKWDRSGTNASLDRINSDSDYSPSNVQWVRKELNKMKGKLTVKQFVELCRLVTQHNPLSGQA